MNIEDRMNVILINARLDKPESGIFYYIEFNDSELKKEYDEKMKADNKLVDFGVFVEGSYYFAEDPNDFEETIKGIGFDNIKDLSAQWDL